MRRFKQADQSSIGDQGSNRDQSWDEWDKKASTGFGNDAFEMAKLVANDINANTTGAAEMIDESTYSVSMPIRWTKDRRRTLNVAGLRDFWFKDAGFYRRRFAPVRLRFASGRKSGKQILGESIVRSRNVVDLTKLPCIEIAEVQVCVTAFLTAFERGTGKVLWRLPSVGITKVQADASDMLYVCTANGSRDSLRYSQDARFAAEGELSILKVDPATGKCFHGQPKNNRRLLRRGERNLRHALRQEFAGRGQRRLRS